MKVSELFHLRYGQSLELNRLTQADRPDGVNFVSRAMHHNGITARVLVDESIPLGQPGDLTVALSGNGVLSTFVQPEPFVCGYHVMIMTPIKPDMSLAEKLWWSRCIWENRYRYSFGRQANRSLAVLELPDTIPPYVSATKLPKLGALREPISQAVALRSPDTWRRFCILDLFYLHKGSRITKRQQVAGNVPFLTASAKDNGITAYISKPPAFPSGSISVPYNGSVGVAFYQPEPFNAGDDVQVLVPKHPITALASLFVCTVIRQESDRYSYGRKWNMERMSRDSLKLPANELGKPDWTYMHDFMAGLPLSRLAQTPAPGLRCRCP